MLYQLRIGVQYHISQVSTIIQDHVQGLILATKEERLLNAPVSLFLGLTFPGKYTNTCSGNCSSSMVLCREYIAGAPFYFRPQSCKCFNQNCSLDGHMQAARNSRSFKGLRRAKFFTD